MLIVLYEPEIPPNTGNIARLCAAFATELHLIEPLGFKLESRYLKRAGLDYWPNVSLKVWPNWSEFLRAATNMRIVLASTKAPVALQDFKFTPEDALVFGPETRGLPENILAAAPYKFHIPMRRMENGGARSLNLSTACGIALYAALASCGILKNFD